MCTLLILWVRMHLRSCTNANAPSQTLNPRSMRRRKSSLGSPLVCSHPYYAYTVTPTATRCTSPSPCTECRPTEATINVWQVMQSRAPLNVISSWTVEMDPNARVDPSRQSFKDDVHWNCGDGSTARNGSILTVFPQTCATVFAGGSRE